ncbi:MAG: MFS transporter [Ignavibacteria bacterium]|nr:MFS transporter [Ignavibacteria bacterium]
MTPKKEKLLLYTLATIQFTAIMDFMIVMPLGPQLMRLFDINPSQFGIIVSSYTFAAGFTGLVGAFFIDRFDRKTALLFNYIGFSIGTILCALAPTYEWLVAARIVTGLFGGVMGALVMSIVGDVVPEFRRATAMGIVMASFSVASIFGVPFGLFLANWAGWHMPFYFLGFMGLIVSGIIYKIVPSVNSHLTKERPSPIQVIKNVFGSTPRVRALMFMFVLVLGQFSIIPYISPYLVANVGFPESNLTYMYLLGGCATIFTSPFIGRMADKYGKPKIFTIMALLSIIPLITTTHMPHAPVWVVLTFSTLFFVFISGRMVPSMALITSTVPPQHRGSFMSINSSAMQLGSGVASFLSGMVIAKAPTGEILNYSYVGYGSVAFTLLAIFLALRIKPVSQEVKVNPDVEKIETEEVHVMAEM